MRLLVHGARGSAPASGAPYRRYGGHTTCLEVPLPGGERLLIDAGSGLARVGEELAQGSSAPLVATLLLTHFHWDHIQGIPFLPAVFDASTRLHIIASPPDGMGIGAALEAVLRPPWFPVPFEEVAARITFEPLTAGRTLRIGPLEVTWAPLAHPGGSTGYRLTHAGRVLVVATDVEASTDSAAAAVTELARGASVLVHDAQYTPGEQRTTRQGWGHSTWEQATRIAAAAGVERLLLTSHDHVRSDDGIDTILAAAREHFARTDAAFEGMEVEW